MTIASTGGTVTLGLYDTQSQLKEKASITYVDNKVDPLQAGHKGYATLVQAQAAQSGLAANTVVEVLSDTTEANNGYYLWNGVALAKTTFSPLVQANNYTDSKVTTAKAEAIATAASDATTKSNNAVTTANSYTDSVFEDVPTTLEPYVTQAEAAATAANIAGKVYATPSEGVAPITGVPSSQYFNVRSSSNDNYIDEYLNNSGVAQATGKSYPSSTYVQGIENYVAKPFVTGKTYVLNKRVQLSNGDIVRSTVAANTVNPNVDMTGWVKVNAASQIFDESGISQQELNSAIQTPLNTGLSNDEAINATASLSALLDPAGRQVVMLQKRIYLIDDLVIPPNTVLYANGAILKRRIGTGKQLITVGDGALLVGCIVDGNQAALISTLTRNDSGIRLGKNAVAVLCESYENYGHGFIEGENSIEFGCISHHNGRIDGASGNTFANFGDGFSCINKQNVQRLFCQAYNNFRNGFTATTYDEINGVAPDYQNPELSRGLKMVGCKGYGNGYVDNDIEGVSTPQVIGCEVNTNFTHTNNMTMTNHIGKIYADSADYANIVGLNVKQDNTNSAVFLRGKSPQLSNITISGNSDVTQSGIAFEVITNDGLGSVDKLSVNVANNAISSNLKNINSICLSSIANLQIYYANRVSLSSGFVSVIDGNITYRGLLNTPTTNQWLLGDKIINTVTDDNNSLICSRSGYGAGIAWTSGASATLNTRIYSGTNVYQVTVAGTLGTIAPTHTSGGVVNGTATLTYVGVLAAFRYLSYRNDASPYSVVAVMPTSITNANDLNLVGKFYWIESALSNIPSATRTGETKLSINTFHTFRQTTTGNGAITQELMYPNLNEKWVRTRDGGIGSYGAWTLAYTSSNIGTTANRPSGNVPIGFSYFDTTIGKVINLKSAGVWVDATGNTI